MFKKTILCIMAVAPSMAIKFNHLKGRQMPAEPTLLQTQRGNNGSTVIINMYGDGDIQINHMNESDSNDDTSFNNSSGWNDTEYESSEDPSLWRSYPYGNGI